MHMAPFLTSPSPAAGIVKLVIHGSIDGASNLLCLMRLCAGSPGPAFTSTTAEPTRCASAASPPHAQTTNATNPPSFLTITRFRMSIPFHPVRRPNRPRADPPEETLLLQHQTRFRSPSGPCYK